MECTFLTFFVFTIQWKFNTFYWDTFNTYFIGIWLFILLRFFYGIGGKWAFGILTLLVKHSVGGISHCFAVRSWYHSGRSDPCMPKCGCPTVKKRNYIQTPGCQKSWHKTALQAIVIVFGLYVLLEHLKLYYIK